MIWQFNGISKLMYLFSNLEFNPDDTVYKQELRKFDWDKMMSCFETTLNDMQREQLELPVKKCGIGGISALQHIFSSWNRDILLT